MLKQVIGILCLLFLPYSAKCRLVPKLSSLVCETLGKNYLGEPKCEIKPIKPYVSEMSVYWKNVYPEPIDNVTVIVSVNRRGDSNSIIKGNFDACAFLRNKKRDPLASMFYKVMGLDTHSNLNHTCPYDHDFILDRYRFDKKYIYSAPFPAGHYTFSTRWFSNGHPMAHIIVNTQLVEMY